jgi:hypothetical protein
MAMQEFTYGQGYADTLPCSFKVDQSYHRDIIEYGTCFRNWHAIVGVETTILASEIQSPQRSDIRKLVRKSTTHHLAVCRSFLLAPPPDQIAVRSPCKASKANSLFSPN